MDADCFDWFTRTLTATPTRRGIARALGGLSLTGLLAPLLGLVDAAAKNKKRRKKKKKKCKGGTKKCGKACIPSTNCCTEADCDDDERCQNGACITTCAPHCGGKECGPDGCGGSCGSCSGGESCQNDGTCSTTTCVPESAAVTCGGRCGTWNNNCGQAVACPACDGSQVCFDNGSCATPCTPNRFCDAGNTCYCSADTEGAGYCRQVLNSCAAVPDTCTVTSDCQTGWACMPVSCPPNVENRCLPLCALSSLP